MSEPIIKKHPSTRGATTAEILNYLDWTDNPVTRSVYRQILGQRIDNALNKRTG